MKRSNTNFVQVPMYILAGVTTLAVEYGTFLIMFYAFGLVAASANFISFIASLTINFLLNKRLVFSVTDANHSWRKQTVFYLGLALLNLAITTAGLHYLLRMGVPAFAAKLFLVVLVASWNFVIYKRVIFSNSASAPK